MTAGLWIEPDWPAPPGVRALSTLRSGGVSRGPFAEFNLADHVDDDPAAVAANRALLRRAAGLPAEPCWLLQVHGRGVIPAGEGPAAGPADGSWTDRPGRVCVVLTADCLPVLLARRDGSAVAALHAGWRGLAAGVLEAGVAALGGGAGLVAWLGPAIGPDHFEVGPEVRDAFLAADAGAAAAFRPAARPGHLLADLYLLARQRLARAGVGSVHGGGECTFADAKRFYSYRRDGVTGRMATLVWRA
ncbi:peptidoglycan editing factor PgeF [Thiohalobacter sp.]|uniref:peptidoglycan editing factor PgeF n=1 Tax=Thiohalobacter sp. TaxID=2025948 RepID=UPI002620E9B9|nr:peptidoglycan editing factor PgeF [Thiohalobacter sp.]